MEKGASCLTFTNIQALRSSFPYWAKSSLPEFVLHPWSSLWRSKSTHTKYKGIVAVLGYLIFCLSLSFFCKVGQVPSLSLTHNQNQSPEPSQMELCTGLVGLSCVYRIISKTFRKCRLILKWSRGKKPPCSLRWNRMKIIYSLRQSIIKIMACDIDKLWVNLSSAHLRNK